MKRLVISAIIVSVAGILGVWWFSPTQVLKRRTESLLATLTLDRGTRKTSRHMATYSLNARLASEVELVNPTIPEANGTLERSDIEAAFSWLCDQAKETRFKVKKFKSVTVNGDTAQVKLSLEGLVVLPTYRPADGVYDATFDWRKEKDGWRLNRAVWKQVP